MLIRLADMTQTLGQDSVGLPLFQSEDAARENINDAFREFDELCERWDNRLSIKNLSLAKRYLEGMLEFGIVLKWQSDSGIINEYVAVFERKFPVGWRASQHRALGHVNGGIIRDVIPYSEHCVRCGYRDEQLMFVGDVETVQTVHGVAASTVRLQSVDEFERIRTSAPQVSFPKTRSVDGFVRTYWETSFSPGRPAVMNDEGMSEIIKGGAQVVDAIPHDCTPVVRDRKSQTETVNFVTGCRASITDHAIRLECVESLDSSIKVRKMFFGPVNLYPSAS
jgi:hypothetical protein